MTDQYTEGRAFLGRTGGASFARFPQQEAIALWRAAAALTAKLGGRPVSLRQDGSACSDCFLPGHDRSTVSSREEALARIARTRLPHTGQAAQIGSGGERGAGQQTVYNMTTDGLPARDCPAR